MRPVMSNAACRRLLSTGNVKPAVIEKKVVEVGPAASTPTMESRLVTIYQPAKSAMQSGRLHVGEWRIDFDRSMSRWENPLMGWTSSRDPMQGVALKFNTKEDAIRFSERQGWKYTVSEGENTNWQRKSYSDNFLYSSDKLKFIRSK